MNLPRFIPIRAFVVSAAILVVGASALFASETAPNSLTAEEKQAGWRLLWDGRTTTGWRSARSTEFPSKGWQIKDGVLLVQKSLVAGGNEGGDIVTRETFSDFELSVDFRITPGANSGIKYFVDADPAKGPISSIGLEYQILDDARHPDAKQGQNGNRTLGSVYDLFPAVDTKPTKPTGEWNTARIVSRGAHVEHWLNGTKIVEYDRFTEPFRSQVKASKYQTLSGFGEWKKGHILLQDHSDEVHFRNIKVRALEPVLSK
jgi:hypothetical protein